MFIRNVYYPYLKEYGLNLINPETPFERDSGKNNFIDFTSLQICDLESSRPV